MAERVTGIAAELQMPLDRAVADLLDHITVRNGRREVADEVCAGYVAEVQKARRAAAVAAAARGPPRLRWKVTRCASMRGPSSGARRPSASPSTVMVPRWAGTLESDGAETLRSTGPRAIAPNSSPVRLCITGIEED